MSFYASMPSPLGAILMRSDPMPCGAAALSGLYFIGQKDCPDIPGFAPMRPEHFDPAAGQYLGRPIRTLKASRQAFANADLFQAEAMPRPAQEASMDASAAPDARPAPMQPDTPSDALALFARAQTELAEYFARDRRVFDLPLQPRGTAFQKQVWDALLRIPYGELVSYGDVARSAGLSAKHSRAVGMAVGRNPLTIVIPCHRVVSGSGTLTGYSGGLDRKLALLEMEGFRLD